MAITDAPTTGLIDRVRAAQRLPAPKAARAIRVAAGVTQQELADELAVDRVTVARWEGGERTPRGELRLRYITLLEQLSTLLYDARQVDEPGAVTTHAVDGGRDENQV